MALRGPPKQRLFSIWPARFFVSAKQEGVSASKKFRISGRMEEVGVPIFAKCVKLFKSPLIQRITCVVALNVYPI